MVRLPLLALVLLLLNTACQQTAPTPAPNPDPAQPNPEGEPAVTPKGDMSTNYSDAAMAVATNDRSEVFVAGVQATFFDRGLSTAYGSKQGGQPGPLRLFVNRYGYRAEALSWSRLIEAPCPTGRTCLVRAAELALAEGDSSLLLSEYAQEDDAAPVWETQALLYKLAADGTVLWQKSVSETENSRALGLSSAADGSSFVLWQAIAEDALNDGANGIKQESYLGVRLSRLGPGGDVLWTRDIETPVSYSFGGSFYKNQHLDIADVTVLGETVVVAGLNSVQAFSAGGEPLWQRALPYIPYDSETEDGNSRYYTRAEVVAEGDRIYVGRSSERSLVMSGPDAQRLELSALDGGGTEVWTKTLGDEQNFVYDTHLSVYSSDFLRNSLVVAGTSLPQLDNVDFAPNSFVSVFNPFGEKGEAQTASVAGTIYGVAAPRSDDGITYIVGVIGDPSFNYDTPESTVQDAFLLFGDKVKN